MVSSVSVCLSSYLPNPHLRVYGPIFIPEVDPAGGFRHAIDLVQLFLARMLATYDHVFVMLTHTLVVLWLLPIKTLKS